MTSVDEHGRTEPPLDADEAATLVGFLDYQRATFAWKVAGVDADGLRRTTAASSMTLGGLVKHLAMVEDYWFSQFLHARDSAEPWHSADFDSDVDWEWTSAGQDSPEQLHELWERSVARSRELLAEALAGGGLEQLTKLHWDNGTRPSLRWVLCHVIEEYARHNGHADLLREAVDGETGE